jgi:hypothetical protein
MTGEPIRVMTTSPEEATRAAGVFAGRKAQRRS